MSFRVARAGIPSTAAAAAERFVPGVLPTDARAAVLQRLPELQADAHAFLVEHSPNTLMDDIEYELSAYGIRVIWNAPNYSWGDLIE